MSVLSLLLDLLDAATDGLQDQKFVSSLLEWNDSVESVFVNPKSEASVSLLEASVVDTISIVERSATLIYKSIVATFLPVNHQDPEYECRIGEALQVVVPSVVAGKDIDLNVLTMLLRTTKNLIRWYIQIVLPSSRRMNGNAPAISENPTEALGNEKMIELYAILIEKNSGLNSNIDRQELARNAGLALFYATYSRSLNDLTVQRAQLFLIETISFPRIAAKATVQHNTIPLLLAVMRNVQNLIVSLPQACKAFEEVAVDLDSNSDKAPWIPQGQDSVGFITATEHLMWWLLRENDPTFPGRAEDRVDDLALEIMRTWYAMRVGRNLESPSVDTRMARIVVATLRLPRGDERCYRCMLAMIGVLSDSNQVFGDYLVSHDVLPFLLTALERQVSYVVDDSVVGSAATTAVVPILVVVNKYSIGSPATKQLVKNLIFPQDAESNFQAKAAEEIRRASGSGIGAKNMAPLDAPKGTLRWKLIKLLTWTESNTKRVAGELLWTICDSDPRQFALWTGLGNALPILAAKGFATLPL